MIKLFDAEYLMNKELTDDDLNILLSNNQLLYSLIVIMFKISKANLSNNKILHIIKTDKNWIYKFYWTKSQKDKFEKILTKIIKNIYQYKDDKLISYVQFWMIYYGLSIKGNNINE